MFTIKQMYGDGTNYHAYSARSYFVNREPVRFSDAKPGDTIYPLVTVTHTDGTEIDVECISVIYIENANGKTIDTVRPWVKTGIAREPG